jgi:N-methylhydantoinase A
VLIPSGAGVGSAFGFLRAPVAYEVARSRYVRLDAGFDPDFVNALFDEMRQEAEAVVRAGAPDATLVETRAADMRYSGQGHEISVSLPLGRFDASLKPRLVKSYERDYAAAFGRTIPGLDVEIMNWTLRLAATAAPLPPCPPAPAQGQPKPRQMRPVFAADELVLQDAPIYYRDDLQIGDAMPGPAVITEIETTTIVPRGFLARIDPLGSIVLEKEPT